MSGSISKMAEGGRTVFVTVGTTSFDELIEKVTSADVLKLLKRLGYTKLICQIGRAEFEPRCKDGKAFCVHSYRYKESIVEDVNSADLIISHAGAGSILESLGAHKPLIVIINENLMGNHQVELADALCSQGHLVYGTCSQLLDILKTHDFSTFKPFGAAQPKKFGEFLDTVMGVPP